jgi:hypothetical protein
MIITGDKFLSSTSKGIDITNITKVDILTSSSDTITIPKGNSLRGTDIGSIYYPNSIIQTITSRYDAQVSLATGTETSGVEITGMRTSITPKFSNSMILCQFQIFHEPSTIDNIFRVFKNGLLIEGFFPSYNKTIGNQHWSGISMVGSYEADYSSTPVTTLFYYHDFPMTTSTISYSPAIKNSTGANVTVTINRPIGSAGASAYEVGVSYTTLWEITQ